MIKIKSLTVKNFMSVGNQTQAVDFDKQQLTLVLGENLDQVAMIWVHVMELVKQQ